MPHTLADPGFVASNPHARADDLHMAFADPAIDGIVATIGGDDSIRLLPLLDLELIRANPKVVLGYSDTTVTHLACLRAGLQTFYGPSIMAGFGENAGLHDYLRAGVGRMLFSGDPPGRWPPNTEGWTIEMPDWADPDAQAHARQLQPCTDWRWLSSATATIEGPLLPACMEVLDWLRGTDWWPPLGGAVLALETSEEAPPPDAVSRLLRSLATMGELQRVAGLLFARPGGVGADQHLAYDAAITRVVHDEQGLDGLPVVTNVDFGHTDPMWTLPVGAPVRVDSTDRTVIFPHRVTSD